MTIDELAPYRDKSYEKITTMLLEELWNEYKADDAIKFKTYLRIMHCGSDSRTAMKEFKKMLMDNAKLRASLKMQLMDMERRNIINF